VDRKIEFSVDGIVQGESGLLRIIGRCCEDTIRVGDFFESIYNYRFSTDADGREITVHVDPAATHLRVVRIHTYGQFLDLLSPGMTGALDLDLDGAGVELVRPGLVLGGEPVAANGQPQSADAKSTSVS
jgi:hypothetical protein